MHIDDDSGSMTHVDNEESGFQLFLTVSLSQFTMVINYRIHFILQYKQMDFMWD